MVERLKISRVKACTLLFFIVSLISIPATLSFGLFENFKICGKTIFDFLDFTTSSILMPLNALFLCIIAGWFLKIKGSRFIQNKFFAVLFDLGLKFVIPVVLLALLYVGLK